MRVAEAVVAGQEPGPEASVGKLLATDTMATTSEVVRLLLGPELTVDFGRWGTWAWTAEVGGWTRFVSMQNQYNLLRPEPPARGGRRDRPRADGRGGAGARGAVPAAWAVVVLARPFG